MAVDYIDIRPLQPRRQQTLVIAKAVFSVLTDDWQSVSQITKLLNHVKASRMEVAGTPVISCHSGQSLMMSKNSIAASKVLNSAME